MKPLYKSYAFRNKDPVVDILRTALQLEADAQGIKFSKVLADVALKSGVRDQTLRNWFFGPTISPRYCCVAAVANVIRASWRVGERELSRAPKLRLVG
jgi:hypothetical protein